MNVDPPGGTQGPLVMLADDRSEYRTTIAFHLAMAGYPVVEAASIAAMLGHAGEIRPDIVVVSDEWEGGDVGKLLDFLRDDERLVDVPVITVSSEPGAGRLAECLAYGARDHVRRQDGAEELVARVDSVLRADDQLERLRRRNAELEFLGSTDPVTGLGNRRRIEEEFDRLSAGASRHAQPLSVTMVRVDDLPDAASPAACRHRRDIVVRELGYLISAVRRADDFAGAWDSSTFVLIQTMTGVEGALAFARRLQCVVKAAPVHDGYDSVAVTLSASCAEVGAHAAGLLHRLEAALASLQSGGGDGIRVAS